MLKGKLGIVVLILALIGTLTGCALPSVTARSTSLPSPFTAAVPPQETAAPSGDAATALPPGAEYNSPLALEVLLEDIYTRINPSVVNIQVLEKAESTFIFPGLQATPSTPQYSSALGSGFVWDTEGYIITNNHVVEGADKITVTFYDGTTVSARTVGTDPDSDLAVIQVDVPESQLHPVTLADSTLVKVGQLSIAIGNPFGLQGTMTVGFISGLGRLIPSSESSLGASYSIPDIIQTDASINPGNSGGVLLDTAGQVIGVTSAIATESGSSAGVGFVIPSSIVQKIVPILIKDGHYDHPWLGVSVTSLTPDINQSMKLKTDQRGALIEQVIANSPAAKAGLTASQRQVTINGREVGVGGDVIIAMGSQTIKSSDDLVAFLSESGEIGQTITLTIIRDGSEMQVPVTLAARPSS